MAHDPQKDLCACPQLGSPHRCPHHQSSCAALYGVSQHLGTLSFTQVSTGWDSRLQFFNSSWRLHFHTWKTAFLKAFTQTNAFLFQGSWGHARCWIALSRLHWGVNNGCHSSLLCLSATGENTWAEIITRMRKHSLFCVFYWSVEPVFPLLMIMFLLRLNGDVIECRSSIKIERTDLLLSSVVCLYR